ncbi:MAG TPA: zeta toxin family protein [Thermoanaerobaculia bacterium]
MTGRPRIFVLAGVNGAGKSSIGGEAFRSQGIDYYNPDEAAREIRESHPKLTSTEANSIAWQKGREMLERAIRERSDFIFETTLGGNTIPRLLREASKNGSEVSVWYVGLESPELHIERVAARVSRGGHPIPEETIRKRYEQSRLNLIHLLPHLTELRVYDNSSHADPEAGSAPHPRLLLHLKKGKILVPTLEELPKTSAWAKPIVMAAFGLT